jgi:hypothetical protein
VSSNERKKQFQIPRKDHKETLEIVIPMEETRFAIAVVRSRVPENGGTCTSHDFQTRDSVWHQLHSVSSPLEWQFRRFHYGLFLGKDIILLLYSTALDIMNLFVAVWVLTAIVMASATIAWQFFLFILCRWLSRYAILIWDNFNSAKWMMLIYLIASGTLEWNRMECQ